MALLRFFMLLSLVVWLGGIIFFAAVLAPTVFSPGLLPSRHLAGSVVNRSLAALHWMGIVSGIVFLVTSMAYCYSTGGSARPLAARHILVYLMLALTIASQFGISPRMQALRTEMVVVDNVPQADPRRVQFNRLHGWSSKLEGGVLLLGLAVLYLTARRLA